MSSRKPSRFNKFYAQRHRTFPNIIDRDLKTKAKSYIFQCSLATVSLIFILLIEDAVFNTAIVVAVASTAFMIFVVPNSVASTPRKVIGGHLIAVVIGLLFSVALQTSVIESATMDSRWLLDIIAAVSVGAGILSMVVTNTEHPPAGGTILGLVIHGWSWSAIIFILSSALILSIIRLLLRDKMVNLL